MMKIVAIIVVVQYQSSTSFSPVEKKFKNEIYKKYRHEDKNTIYTSDVQEKQSQILEQLYSTICSICNIKSMIE